MSFLRAGFAISVMCAFFSVQRLHGFRQVVTHVQSQQKDKLQIIMQGRLNVDSLIPSISGCFDW